MKQGIGRHKLSVEKLALLSMEALADWPS